MSDIMIWLTTIFGGVIGGAIGFLLVAFIAMVLVLPYIVMTHNRPPSNPSRDDAVPSDRY